MVDVVEQAFADHCKDLQTKLGEAISAALEDSPSDPLPAVAIHILKALPVTVCLQHAAVLLDHIASANDTRQPTDALRGFERSSRAAADAAAAILHPKGKSLEPPAAPDYWVNYVEKTWEKSHDAPPPQELRLRLAEGAISQIAPLYLETRHMDYQVQELTEQKKATRQEALVVNKTFIPLRLEQTTAKFVAAEATLKAAIEKLDDLISVTAKSIARPLVKDSEKYFNTLIDMDNKEPGVLLELQRQVEQLVNRDHPDRALRRNDEVTIIDPTTQQMVRAKVAHLPGEMPKGARSDGEGEHAASVAGADRAPLGKGKYELLLWNVCIRADEPYEEGFETRHKLWAIKERHEIYHHSKHEQMLSHDAISAARRRHARAETPSRTAKPTFVKPDPTSDEFLMLLYSDAERTVPHLKQLSDEVVRSVRGTEAVAAPAPLKSTGRAVVKTLEKYDGRFSKLTDLVRMTFKCNTIGLALKVLKALNEAEGWELLHIKNRLSLSFSAEGTGGYRDLLLNLRCVATAHIAEVQITLAPLLDIKRGDGHKSYALGRLLRLNDHTMFCHTGRLTKRVISDISSGILREVVCVAQSSLTEHFDELLNALRSPYCSLRVLSLSSCDWPQGRKLEELLRALIPLGSQLREIIVAAMYAGGRILPEFLEACNQLCVIDFGMMDLEGAIPPQMGGLADLTTLLLGKNKLEGSVPDEMGRCTKLKVLSLHTNKLNKLSSASSAVLTKSCPALAYVRLDGNRFGEQRTAEIDKEWRTALPKTTNLFVGSSPDATPMQSGGAKTINALARTESSERMMIAMREREMGSGEAGGGGRGPGQGLGQQP